MEHTHRLRPKGTDKWQHVTATELETITSQVGPRTLKANYQVEPLASKPAPLPTTTPEATTPDEAPVTPRGKKQPTE